MPSAPGFPPRTPVREPMLNLPRAVVWLILAMTALQAVREVLSAYNDFLVLSWLSFVPARLTLWLWPESVDDIVRSLTADAEGGTERLQLARLLLADGGTRLWTLLTYGLLHGSWLHLATNMLWLAAFGSPVARRLGAGRFLNLLALSSIAGALLHWWTREYDVAPLVGASAGISGATAAAIRFAFAPGLPFGMMGDDRTVRAIPAEPFGQLWRNPRAMIFVAVWFGTNLIFGAGLVPILGEDASIAWEAHIGGFLAGLVLFPLFDRGRLRV